MERRKNKWIQTQGPARAEVVPSGMGGKGRERDQAQWRTGRAGIAQAKGVGWEGYRWSRPRSREKAEVV